MPDPVRILGPQTKEWRRPSERILGRVKDSFRNQQEPELEQELEREQEPTGTSVRDDRLVSESSKIRVSEVTNSYRNQRKTSASNVTELVPGTNWNRNWNNLERDRELERELVRVSEVTDSFRNPVGYECLR